MTVVLEIIDIPPVSQGYTGDNIEAKLENSGTENVKNVDIKVIDAVIYTAISIYIGAGGTPYTCLNTFTGYYIHNFDDSNNNFPAGTTKLVKFYIVTKADAPVAINDVSTHFTFEVY